MSTSASSSSSSSSPEEAITELKLYQAFIFSVPIFFTFVLLFLFYLFYLRRRRVDWASLRMRTTLPTDPFTSVELGVKKELREMLPIIVYKESFSVKDTQCPVCLGDYQAEDRLQQIPACGHTFHMDCIDSWLANHTTCPLCRLSLLASAKVSCESPNNGAEPESGHESSVAADGGETSLQHTPEDCNETQASQFSELRNEESRTTQNNNEEERGSECAIEGRDLKDARAIEGRKLTEHIPQINYSSEQR